MYFHFLLIAVFLGLIHAQNYRCPTSVQMQPCRCEETPMGLGILCENVKVYTLLEVLMNAAQTKQPVALALLNIGLPSLTMRLLVGLDLRVLRVSNCNLTSVDEYTFAMADKLEGLSLSENALEGVPSQALRTLSLLKYLDLNSNRLEVLRAEAFKGLHSLNRLSLAGNKIKFIYNAAFEGIGRNFTALYLGNNQLTAVPTGPLRYLNYLEILDLDRNKIVSLRTDEFAVTALGESLCQLFLNDNAIRQLPSRAFTTLKKLALLDLSGNAIESIHPSAFQGTEGTLKHIELDTNRLKDIPSASLKNLNRLEILQLSDNSICTVRKDDFSPYGRNLRVIRLGNNSLTSVDPESFVHLDSLRTLTLDRNQLTIVPYETYEPVLDTLETFEIYDNPLHCDCEISWLADWMKGGNKSEVIAEPTGIKCSWPKKYVGMSPADIPRDGLLCRDSTSKPVHKCDSISSHSQRPSINAFVAILQGNLVYFSIAFGFSRLFR